jgi:hypothetical protein
MAESPSRWCSNPLILGPLIGWLVGVLWWAGLMIAFGPTVIVTRDSQWTIPVALRLLNAPLVAIPWAVVGFVAGVIASIVRGPWVPTGTALGAIVGGSYSLTVRRFDGWLALTMQIDCLGAALAGVIAGAMLGVIWRGLVVPSSAAEPSAAADRPRE